MDENVIGRMRHVLAVHKERLRGWTALMQAIAEANDQDRERHIDRRTLERICGEDAEKVQLRIGQLIALDNFFVRHNEKPLLTKSLSPIDSVAESFNANLFVAANFHPAINDDAIARWDLRALTRLMRTRLNALQIRIWDVLGPENWRGSDTRIHNAANIAIGSPVANYASEVLLAGMVGVSPRKKCPIESLPFMIVRAARDKSVRSAFVRARHDAMRIDAGAIESLEPERRGIAIGGRVYVSNDSRDYGLLVAQRNPANGQVQMVLSGLTGQATYWLARILQDGQPACTLPRLLDREDHPPILVTLYELTLAHDDQGRGRNKHRVVRHAPVVGPAFMHHMAGQWRFVQSNGSHGD